MIDFQTAPPLGAVLADHRFIEAAAIALIAGLVRGFSGFGSSPIYMPLVSAVYEPRIAAVTLLTIDFVSSTPFTIPEFRRCAWRGCSRSRSRRRSPCRSRPGR